MEAGRSWVDSVHEDMRRLGGQKVRRVPQDREEWRHVILVARVLREL